MLFMCKVFPSRLGEFGLHWFDRLPSASISSNKQLSTAFLVRFVTNTKQKKTVDSLFGLTMEKQETLRQYASRYWELFNEIKGCNQCRYSCIQSESALTQAESSLFGDLVKGEEQTMNSLMVTIEKHC